LLDRAAALVKRGGRIAYVTCSLLVEENQDQVRAFVGRQPHFAALQPEQVADALGARAAAFREAVQRSPEGLLMTPRRTQTDGFFVALLAKQRD
jgi:16S rRNA (cytosine967-C5)-methyltransferase